MRNKVYVCGFLFDCEAGRVALIKKNKPNFQLGKLNGIGGKVEPGETSREAMQREFKEETGADVIGWSHFCTLNVVEGPATIEFFVSCDGANVELQSLTDEEVGWHSLNHWEPLHFWCSEPHMSNLKWLVPLALEHLSNHKSALVLSEKP